MHQSELRSEYERFSQEGERLAGGLTDLAQRATVYHHVFHDSGRNHVFPLIAAHGALWARGYFAFGMRLARWLSWQYRLDPELRQKQLAAVETFANVLRDINRRVCADTYASYRFTAIHGKRSGAEEIIAPPLLDSLNRVHSACLAGKELADDDKHTVFQAHFLNEQENVVGPNIARGIEELRWPLVRFIALKPLIRFAYFGRGEWLWFSNFSSREERIANGRKAFDLAARRGWSETAAALRQYRVLPVEFFADSSAHFCGLKKTILALN